ncbi:hypothetical protein ILUMI_15749, partial [Ignelater luminosus]
MMTRLHHELSPKSSRKLAYHLAIANKKKIPKSWENNSTEARLWFNGFLKRPTKFSLRTAEATPLGRAMEFNKPV